MTSSEAPHDAAKIMEQLLCQMGYNDPHKAPRDARIERALAHMRYFSWLIQLTGIGPQVLNRDVYDMVAAGYPLTLDQRNDCSLLRYLAFAVAHLHPDMGLVHHSGWTGVGRASTPQYLWRIDDGELRNPTLERPALSEPVPQNRLSSISHPVTAWQLSGIPACRHRLSAPTVRVRSRGRRHA